MMFRLRNIIKNIFKIFRYILSAIFAKVLTNIFIFTISLLPSEVKANLSEFLSQNNICYLDYDKAKIRIFVDSFWTYYRTKSCKKEPHTVKWIEDNFLEGDIFFDIGANTGSYSFVACEYTNHKIKIFAFEPSPSTFNILCKNIYLNKYEDIIMPICMPLSKETAFVDFVYNSFSSGDARHKGLEIKSTTDNSINNSIYLFSHKVIAFSLDNLIEDLKLEYPNHIKLDVDGHEYPILLGATKTLNSHEMKTVQVEIDEERNECQLIKELLIKANFHMHEKFQHGNAPLYDYIFMKNTSKKDS